ncbi:GntR family transcriptional regulator [Dictyobacter sp. S3.2.2.5]|uniref:GntR family transcriptional regulator n=2 Tax=Dictyobacter halimunensis TaxID=3026934 RepID=A0ABQ6FZR0_9CHLR|nr:GntR family transcriptional regulator [Dictyobacter sp. S3.2.2.5]
MPELNLPLTLVRNGQKPLYRQLYEQLRAAILNGSLAPGVRLPSSRALAEELGIARNSVVSVYEELLSEGYLVSQHGSGTSVSSELPSLPKLEKAVERKIPRWLMQEEPVISEAELPLPALPGQIDFRLGVTSTALWPQQAWQAIWREVSRQQLPGDYGDPGGEGALRTAIASYVGRARGVACQPEDVIIVAGTVQALDLIARATLGMHDAVAMEEPGYPLARAVFQSRQVQVVPVPVDTDGLRVEMLPCGATAPTLVYVTPSHQYPLGTRLSIARRLTLLEWAREHESLVIEDDYDSEFRFGAQPLPALASLDDLSRVAYIGSFSKVLTPALRAGYLIAPPLLRERITRLKLLSDIHLSWPLQQGLALFLQSRNLERYIQRLRQHYAEKRATLLQALAPVAGLVEMQGLDAGLHACLELKGDDVHEAEIVARSYQRGVVVYALHHYYLGLPDKKGLLLGYGGLEEAQIMEGAKKLAAVIRQTDKEKK